MRPPEIRQCLDEIIAFSHSSIELLKRAYERKPGEPVVVREESVTVQPHSVDYIDRESLVIKNRDQLIIGIVGQIGFHKGASFIQALAQEIEQQGAKERIAVIGSLEGRCNPAIVRQSGPYKREDLAKAILESGANIMLFPSIWPETFSYVTQEIIQFGLPLACFSYGAPAERVNQYEKGLVLESQDPSDVLESLRQLFQASYHMSASAQDT
jgi:glycosyltransferase involved in cell wall biosynthesis